MKTVILLILTSAIFSFGSFAQQIPLDKKDVPPYIEEIKIQGTDHYFSNVEQIIQTKDGYIWLATNRGLYKYNGIDFTPYNSLTNPGLFINPSILSLLEDDDNNLWIGTRAGLIMMKNNTFSQCFDSTLRIIGIVRMCKDDKGNIYLGTLQKGLFRINPDKSLYKYSEPLDNDIIFSLLYSDNTLWIGTSTQGLIKLKDEKFEYMKNISPHFSYEMRASHKDKSGNYWFGSSKNGLVKYSNNKVEHYTIQNGFGSDKIHAIAESADGSLLLGSYGGGLIKMENNRFTSYNMDNGLTINAIRSLYHDKEGNLWIGLLGGGLNILRQQNVSTYNMRHKLNDNYIHTISSDLSGNIWIGTNGNGINVITKNKLLSYAEDLDPNITTIRTITHDSKGRHWIGTYGNGIVLIDENNNRTNYSRTNGLFVSDTINSIYEDSKGTIWISAEGKNIVTYKDGKIEYSQINNKKTMSNLRYIKEDYEHNYWFATNNINGGIFKYSNNKLTNYLEKDVHGLSSNNILSFFIMEDSSIIVCTGKGLCKYKDEKFLNITFGNVFDAARCYEILEDNIGNYWMSSSIGILAFKKEDLTRFINGEIDFVPNKIIGKEDGMLTQECNGGSQNSGAKSPDGRLWFPTPNGVVVIDPEKIFKQRNEFPPNVFIENFFANDSLIDAISNDEIKIPANSRNIQIFYSALSYKNTFLNKYKYRLIGSDTNWIDAGNKNMAYYSTLPHGEYTFEVIASNSDLVWNVTGAQLTFTVLPKFYQRTDFIVSTSLFAAASLFFIYKLRVRNLRMNEIKLKKLVDEQTAALQHEIEQRKKQEEKLLRMRKVESLSLLAGGIAHDFNNLLTAILGNISILKYKLAKNDSTNLAKLVESSEAASLRAKNLTQQLLTFSKEGKPVLKHISISKLVEECTTFILRGSSIKGFFDIADDIWDADVDEGQINRVIQNLILNAKQAMSDRGNIYVTAKNINIDNNSNITIYVDAGDYIQISIKDTGTGISKENISKIFDPYFTTKKTGHGLGLAACFTIIKNHKGHIDVHSELGVGTEFSIYLPRTQKKYDADTDDINIEPNNPKMQQ